jgi:predicted nucleotidyltransferase
MVGNQRQISANKKSPVFNELRALTQKVLGVAPILQEALSPLAKKIELALLYGSVAKESDSASSDIDVLLVGHDLSLGEILAQLIPAEDILMRKINPTCYGIDEFIKRRDDPDSFVSRVLGQPTLKLIGDPDVFRRTENIAL